MNVPDDKVAGLYGEFIFELELFKEMDGLNTAILDFPVFKVKYYPGLKNLDYDKKHENKIRSRMNVLLKEYTAEKKRLEEVQANNEANEARNRLDKDYSDQLDVASALLKEKKYEEAQAAYEKALVIKPKADFPREKIVAIEKLIKDRDKVKKLSPAMEKRYTEMITAGDAAFVAEKFTTARSHYKRARLIAPDRPYPKSQIELAKEEIALNTIKAPFNNILEDKYKLIIDRANNEFMGEDYVRARASYAEALRVKKGDPFAKGRIEEINKIVAANRKSVEAAATPEKTKGSKRGSKGSKTVTTTAKSTEEDMDSYLLALADQYDEGITEEIEVVGGKKVTRIIVVKDGKANEYKKEVFSWATYYKKNNKTIPRYLFESETKH